VTISSFTIVLLAVTAPVLSNSQYEERHGQALLRISVEPSIPQPSQAQARLEEGPGLKHERRGLQNENHITNSGAGMVVSLASAILVEISVEGPNGLEMGKLDSITPSPDWRQIAGSERVQVKLTHTLVRWKQNFRLDPQRPGDFSLEILPLRFRLPERGWQTVSWHKLPIQVTSGILKADLRNLRDIAPLLEPSSRLDNPPYRRYWILLGIAAVSAAMGMAWHVVRRRRPRSQGPPYQIALSTLDRLKKSSLATQEEIHHFHVQLVDTVREYLTCAFGIPAQERTTSELETALQACPEWTSEQRSTLHEFMERCDLVKFAGGCPTLGECRELINIAAGFVDETEQSRSLKR
jgi:hypothetical protein